MDDIITQITENRQGANVTVNDTEKLWFSRSLWRERALTEGESVSLEELREWLLPRQYMEALNLAVAFLAVRARSGGEVRRRLESKGYMEDTVDMVLYKLEQNELLDDAAFARDYAQSRMKRSLGRERIARELRAKGLNTDLIQQTLEELDGEQEDEHLTSLAIKLLTRHRDEESRKAMSKVMAGLVRRGYSYEQASTAIANALHEMESESFSR